MTTLAQALAAALIRHTDQTFGLMGNGNAHLIDALGKLGAAFSEVRHEAATVASADAYTRITGKIAIATTTYGAGFTNTLTALAEAAQARTPMLVVVGDEPTAGRRPWGIDQEQAAASVGVRSYTLQAHDVERAVDEAVNESLRERRPVVLALPYDLVSAEVSTEPSQGATEPSPAHEARVTPAVSDLDAAAQVLAQAERPVILAGRGAHLSGAQEALGLLADRLGALTATTTLARGIFPNPEFDLGVTGGFGQEAAMEQIAAADVVLTVGASLNQFTMRFGDLFGEGTTLVRIDVDEVAPPKSPHVTDQLLLQGDARAVLAELIDRLGQAATRPGWREQVQGLEPGGELRALDRGATGQAGLCEDGRLDPRAVAARIGELLPEDRHVTSDGGHFIGWANMFWPVTEPSRMIMVGTAYQTIGLGFSTVAGVAAAAPESTVVLTTGDGGGLMALADLETAIRTTRSCVIVVWNDGAYGAEVHLYGVMGLDEAPMRIPDVNFAGLATALGATGVRVESLADLDELAAWSAAGAKGTMLLDCRVSRSVVAPYQREIQRVNGLDVVQ